MLAGPRELIHMDLRIGSRHAESFVSPNLGSSGCSAKTAGLDRRSLITCTVRPMAAVLRLVLGGHSRELSFTRDQHPVEASSTTTNARGV